MELPEEVKEKFRQFGSKGGKKQKKNVSSKQLSRWGKKGARVRKAIKEANATN